MPAFTAVAIFYLLVPIIVMIAFSFNDPPGRFNFVWGRLSLDAWENPSAGSACRRRSWTSLLVAVGSTIVATSLGTLIGLAMSRYDFRRPFAANCSSSCRWRRRRSCWAPAS